MNEKIALLAKIKALADRGEAGERESAAGILARMMDKYGIVEADLEDLSTSRVIFKYRSEHERKIIVQTLVSVTDKSIKSYKDGRYREIFLDLTPSEKISVSYAVEFYLEHFRRELQLFTAAFIDRNGLYPKFEKYKRESTDISEQYSDDELETIVRMASGLDRHAIYKAIEGGER